MQQQQAQAITGDCWSIQLFGGIERCATCEFFPFNQKTGKLLKSSCCGGGQTLAFKIYNKFGDSIFSAIKAREFWNQNPKASFVEFVEYSKKEYVMHYSLRKYKRFIRNLQQIAKEQEEHQKVKRLDQIFPYEDVRQKGTITQKESYHYVPNRLCDCQIMTTRKGAYRLETYNLEMKALFYLHQHCVVMVDHAAHTITLDSCEWRTLTTKKRINEAISQYGYYLYSEKFQWKIHNRYRNETVDFYDGIVIQK